jgi:hypothetical protein
VQPDLSLLLIIKYERNDKLRKDLLREKKRADDLENSQPVGIVCSTDRTKRVARQLFFEEIRCVIDPFSHLCTTTASLE